ncbi:hypothetical protein F4810DRAFT_150274 [Camillea tinctor]|nr:hypothetical protein F4810DRAFT_150274 [Camillea tinctor]
MARKKNRAFKQQGFAFGEGSIFSSDELKERIQGAILGTNEEIEKAPVTALRNQAAEKLERLFELCLEHSALGEVVRLGPVYWKVVSDEWLVLILYLEPNEVEEVARVFTEARENYKHTVVNTKLTRSVDKFIELRNRIGTLPPATEFRLELRPTALEQTQREMANLQVRPSTETPGSSTMVWPPKHFNQHECIWVSDTRVRWQLFDVNHLTAVTKNEDYPMIPSSYSHPIDVKLLLCWMGLVKNAPTSKWALYSE